MDIFGDDTLPDMVSRLVTVNGSTCAGKSVQGLTSHERKMIYAYKYIHIYIYIYAVYCIPV